MFNKLRHSRAGFTLVEMILAMAILGIMSTMTLLIYFNISETSRRLQISRELSETARQITEKISQEVRANGVYVKDIEKISTTVDFRQNFLEDYKENADLTKWQGSEILVINVTESSVAGVTKNTAKKYFLYGSDNWTRSCDPGIKNDLTTHCGLYFFDKTDADPAKHISYNLVDSFRSEENRKRVKISDLKFYVSGGDHDMKKVTLKMTLQLMARDGVPASLIGNTKMEIQTTFSERPYKIN